MTIGGTSRYEAFARTGSSQIATGNEALTIVTSMSVTLRVNTLSRFDLEWSIFFDGSRFSFGRCIFCRGFLGRSSTKYRARWFLAIVLRARRFECGESRTVHFLAIKLRTGWFVAIKLRLSCCVSVKLRPSHFLGFKLRTGRFVAVKLRSFRFHGIEFRTLRLIAIVLRTFCFVAIKFRAIGIE